MTLLASCQTSRSAFTQSGDGSYYADKFAGRPTASGVPYRPNQLTAAHNTLPFGTRIEVTNLRTGRSVQVVVNDRGPHVKGRIVDVSKRAARPLGLLEAGVVPVRLRVVRAARPPLSDRPINHPARRSAGPVPSSRHEYPQNPRLDCPTR